MFNAHSSVALSSSSSCICHETNHLDGVTIMDLAEFFYEDQELSLIHISRGKTELALTVVNIGAPEASISVNLDLAKGYLDAIGEMSSALGVENDVTAGTLTRFSDIFTTRKAETDEEQL